MTHDQRQSAAAVIFRNGGVVNISTMHLVSLAPAMAAAVKRGREEEARNGPRRESASADHN